MNEHTKKEASGDAHAFKVELVPLEQIEPSARNGYSVDDVTELKASIELLGLQQNLLLRKVAGGKYEIISGHRRYKALKSLHLEGKEGYSHAPCKIIKSIDDLQAELELILANSTTRRLTDYEISYQAERLRELLVELKKSGVKFMGKKREIVAELLKVSPSQVARYEGINKNLSPGLKDEFKKGTISVTTAYEASRLDDSQQADVLGEHKAGATLTPEAVKQKRETGKATVLLKPNFQPFTPQTTEPVAGQELLPCPFCGHSASLNKNHDKLSNSRWVTCDGCLVATPGYSGKETAVMAWNKRIKLGV